MRRTASPSVPVPWFRRPRWPALFVQATGYTQTLPFTITVGRLGEHDPVGDGPRRPSLYWAYDDGDRSYSEHPTFSWVEIGNQGTRLPLGDNQTIALPLPEGFGPFIYYGRRYDTISVCSNGWVAPGTTTATSWTNYRLPKLTAPPLIAVNWDDLYPGLGNGIWFAVDTAHHRLVIEWDSVHYRTPANVWDKFELVIYDTTRAAGDGNSEFDLAYYSANWLRSSTVGIQDPTYQIGITCLYDTAYHVGTSRLGYGRCIRFTTDVPLPGIGEADGKWAPAEERPMGRAGLVVVPTVGRGAVVIRLTLSGPGPVELAVYDVTGRQVATIVRQTLPAGLH